MSDTEKPDWWPECPYPEDIFVMNVDRYAEIVPDPDLRTALSGCLGRRFWGITSDAIWDAFRTMLADESVIEKLVEANRLLTLRVAKISQEVDEMKKWPDGDEFAERVYRIARSATAKSILE